MIKTIRCNKAKDLPSEKCFFLPNLRWIGTLIQIKIIALQVNKYLAGEEKRSCDKEQIKQSFGSICCRYSRDIFHELQSLSILEDKQRVKQF